MPKVTFLTPDGKTVEIENAVGTLMEVALENDIDGITGDCGGVGSCSPATFISPHGWIALARPIRWKRIRWNSIPTANLTAVSAARSKCAPRSMGWSSRSPRAIEYPPTDPDEFP